LPQWLSFQKGGSKIPETWLSLSGTVAHFDPEYSGKLINEREN
jgi:hypothetical protein